MIEQAEPTFLLVVGFGAILKRDVLDTVAGQVLNIHPSMLPEYRGPAPVVQALLDGVRETGVSLMEIDTKMDHGPVLAQERHPLRCDELPDELYQILTKRGVQLFLENIDDYLEERLTPTEQNHLEASFSHFIKKEDGRLDFSKPADELEREIRAYAGWPRSYTEWKKKRLIIDKARLSGGKLKIEKVQPEGGKVMELTDFLAGQRIKEEEFYTTLGLEAPNL